MVLSRQGNTGNRLVVGYSSLKPQHEVLLLVDPTVIIPVFVGGTHIRVPPELGKRGKGKGTMPQHLKYLRGRVTARVRQLQAAQSAGANAQELRHIRRALARNRKTWKRAKRLRTARVQQAQRRTQATRTEREKDHKRNIRLATWNTRGLGSRHSEHNQEMKLKCFIHRMVQQRWGCLVLTDLKYAGDQVRSCAVQGGTWTLVVRQQVGFLLSDTWREWWEEGGSRTYSGGSRVAGIQFPRRGWRRGIFVIGVYAPTSSSTVQERHQLRDQVSNVINMAQATSISLLLGDINAELGNNQNANTLGHTVVGRFARPKITTAGQEWRQWAEAEGFRDCASRYQLRHRTTWQHPRYRSEHELDHISIREECLWHLQHCRVLQEGPNVAWPWGDYTDHNPVEVRLRHGRMGQATCWSDRSPLPRCG